MKTIDGKKLLHYEVQKSYKEDDKYIYYLAKSAFYDKKVSIITLRPTLANQATEQQALRNNKQQMAALQHPNLPLILDIIEEEGKLYVVEEYTQGKTLKDYISQISGPIPEEKAIRLFSQLLDTIQFLHHRGIVPASIHPEEILITTEENLKFLYHPDTTSPTTQEIAYQSPEQLKGDPPSIASNIFSLGLVLYQMVAGRHPLQEDDSSLKEKLIKAKFPPANRFYPGVFERVQGILDKALQKQPHQRFQSCDTFKKVLTYDRFIAEAQTVPRDAFTQLPLTLLSTFVVFVIILLFFANRGEEEVSTLAYDLQDTSYINKRTDSLKTLRLQKLREDSLRIAKIQARDTMKLHIHKVKRGESLQRIAKRYNMSLGHLKRLNNIESNEDLKAGSGMRVVVRAVHKVMKGEDLRRVAGQYELTYWDLVRTNAIKDEEEEVFDGKDLLIDFE
ncbi:MAG: protein kinase [Thermonemataceae bacterium]